MQANAPGLKKLRSACALLFTITISVNCVWAKGDASYPRLISGAKTAEGKMVLEIARAAFHATSPRLYETGAEVREKHKTLVLCQDGHVELQHDDTAIETLKDTNDFTFIYIQKNKFDGNRFVVGQCTHSWRGDVHSLVRVPEGLSQEETISVLQNLGTDKVPDRKGSLELFNDSWTGPWVVEKDGKTCGIDTGQPFDPLGIWTVYSISGGAEPVAKIAFRPPADKTMILIPAGPLREIAILLDNIVGIPKEWQGTLNANGRVHADVRYVWMNLVYRPWAMGTAYNTKARVESGLLRWSKGSKVYKQQYDKLKTLYPQAEAQLAQHYKNRFHMSDGKAKKAAKTWMDTIYRSHFVFPSE